MMAENHIKVVILAGGLGTRLAEETEIKPKPMVEIGEEPILWHIMKHYCHYDFREFYIALGYKGEVIKRYFMDYLALNGNLSVDLSNGKVERDQSGCEDWLIHLVETGQNTNTGGRVKRLKSFLKNETFMLTYGDGIGDIDLKALLAFHRSHGRLVTLTAVRPPARFGGLIFDGDMVVRFTEKPQAGEGWINGGFMVCEPGIFDYIADDQTSFEVSSLEHMAVDGQLAAFRHEGFWQCMDTLRDKRYLEGLWQAGNAPWKTWRN
jgi:glucose-1-phosphate cytidylyltransferase